MAEKITRQRVLSDLIREHGWRFGAELGVWQGATFEHLLRTFPQLTLYGVDNWKPAGAYAMKDMLAPEDMVRLIAKSYTGRCYILKMDTVRAADFVSHSTLDFVFIDASHDTASVAADIRAWRPKVRKTGWLTGHDANLETVRAALDAELPGWRRLEANCWAFPLGGE